MSNKTSTSETITLIEEGELISTDQEVANLLNDFFSSIVTNLNLPKPPEATIAGNTTDDPISNCILKFSNHPSVRLIKEKCYSISSESFQFCEVTSGDVKMLIKSLDSNKAVQETDIPTHLIKDNTDLFTPFLHHMINASITEGTFPDNLKRANVTPVHKKSDKTKKDNYRPISILPNMSKIYERVLHMQL